MRDLLARALPMLVQLGDYIGNGPIDPTRADSLGSRCDLIGDIHAVLAGEPVHREATATCGQPIDAVVPGACEKPVGHAGPCRAFSAES